MTATATKQLPFTLDMLRDEIGTFPAVRYGNPWNGWATPVVTAETMAALADALNVLATIYPLDEVDQFRRDGDAWVVWREGEDYVTRIEPDADGNYDLSALGYTFEVVDQCEVCEAAPATDSVRDVNGMPDGVEVWVAVCGDDCIERLMNAEEV